MPLLWVEKGQTVLMSLMGIALMHRPYPSAKEAIDIPLTKIYLPQVVFCIQHESALFHQQKLH